MSKGRMQAGSCTAGMRREEVEALIRAANLGEEDSYIARRCLIDQVAQLDIAFEMEDKFGQGMTRSTVSRRMQGIERRLHTLRALHALGSIFQRRLRRPRRTAHRPRQTRC